MSDKVSDDVEYLPDSDAEKQREKYQGGDERRRASIASGQVKHNKLGWRRLTVGNGDCAVFSLQFIEHGHGPL